VERARSLLFFGGNLLSQRTFFCHFADTKLIGIPKMIALTWKFLFRPPSSSTEHVITQFFPIFLYFTFIVFYVAIDRQKVNPEIGLRGKFEEQQSERCVSCGPPKIIPPSPNFFRVCVYLTVSSSASSAQYFWYASRCVGVCVWLYTVIGGKRFTLFFFTVTWLFQKDTQRISSWPKSVGRFVYDLSRS